MNKYFLYTAAILIMGSSSGAMAQDFTYSLETDPNIHRYGEYQNAAPLTNNESETKAKFSDNSKVYFDSSRKKLQDSGERSIIRYTEKNVNFDKAVLDRQARFLKNHPETDLHIEGYTDPRGHEDANKRLGHKRAEEVKNYLIKQGIDGNRLHIVSVGEDTLKFNNDEENRHATSVLQK